MIQDIAIEQLDIHPQNVRKVYTDIDELAESIKARGVMQNLTVVPNPDKKDHYLVVIGNRRLTAARKAGLKTMPCSVVEMTEKEQISTMLEDHDKPDNGRRKRSTHERGVWILRDRKRVRSERRGKRTDRKRICRNKPRKANADPLDPDGRAVRSN